jgi:hypothetical protein
MSRIATSLAVVLLSCGLLHGGDDPGQRSAGDVKKQLATITAAPDKKTDAMTAEREAALRRLAAYRYLAGVPRDVVLDDDYNAACQAAARLLVKIGRLEHTPKNPGLPEDEFKLAFKGTSQSNLAVSVASLEKAVDLWMNDSDEGNVQHLGHRRWCLNPGMRKTGFGHSGDFFAMFAFDNSRKDVPDFDFVCWPARGPMPVEFFPSGAAWSVSLDPRKYNQPGNSVTPKIYAADDKGDKTGDPLPLASHKVNTDGFGVPNCIIFRPEKVKVEPGRRYVVEIEGLTSRAKKEPVVVRFTVEFIGLK